MLRYNIGKYIVVGDFMRDNILDHFRTVLPLLSELMQEEVASCITDSEKCLAMYSTPNMPIFFKEGDLIPKDTPLYKSIQTKKIVAAVVPKEVFGGTPFLGISYPILDPKGEIIGAVGIAKSLDKQYKLEEISEDLFSSLSQTSEAIDDIATGSQKLANVIGNINAATNKANEKISATDLMINSIKKIAQQSNLLALNGSIESSRAGEQGKGFSIVAKEMRKLAQISNESAKEVSQIITEIKKLVYSIISEINDANIVAESHSAATEEINATINELTEVSKELYGQAKI